MSRLLVAALLVAGCHFHAGTSPVFVPSSSSASSSSSSVVVVQDSSRVVERPPVRVVRAPRPRRHHQVDRGAHRRRDPRSCMRTAWGVR